MSFDANAPEIVVAAQAALAACASIGSLATSYHYPEAGLKTTALPFAVLAEGDYAAERVAAGETFERGTVVATFYIDSAITTQGAAEKAAAAVCRELSSLTGAQLFVTSASRSLASKVRRSKVAATNDSASRSYFTIQLTMEYSG
jgi:hypothetical protein